MEWWLNVFFLINGVWVPGETLDGWAPRSYPSEATCVERRIEAEANCRANPLSYEARWFCSAGEPALTLPEGLERTDC